MRIGTRGSALALTQSGYVRGLLPGGESAHRLDVIETAGDRNPQASLRRIGGKGVFTKEIEIALLDGRIDLAVHSLKDLPTEETPGLTLGALLPREDPRDALVTLDKKTVDSLPAGAKIGTSSLRRRSQLLARRPDLLVEDLRGNVPTRLARLEDGRLRAVIVAAAGLKRLKLLDRASELIDESVMLPAPGQGILALQIRSDDPETARVVRMFHDPAAQAEADAERTFLSVLGGGCLVPVGARATAGTEGLSLSGYVGHPSGRPSIRLSLAGSIAGAAEIGRELANAMLSHGAKEILDEVRSDEVFP